MSATAAVLCPTEIQDGDGGHAAADSGTARSIPLNPRTPRPKQSRGSDADGPIRRTVVAPPPLPPHLPCALGVALCAGL